eukprot:m.93440 g.93440  ORF g.93440 m.93440 type:complete len:259 (+) comp12997_c2_seq6:175-951(+)
MDTFGDGFAGVRLTTPRSARRQSHAATHGHSSIGGGNGHNSPRTPTYSQPFSKRAKRRSNTRVHWQAKSVVYTPDDIDDGDESNAVTSTQGKIPQPSQAQATQLAGRSKVNSAAQRPPPKRSSPQRASTLATLIALSPTQGTTHFQDSVEDDLDQPQQLPVQQQHHHHHHHHQVPRLPLKRLRFLMATRQFTLVTKVTLGCHLTVQSHLLTMIVMAIHVTTREQNNHHEACLLPLHLHLVDTVRFCATQGSVEAVVRE